MNQGMHNELMGQLMQLNQQLTELRTLVRAIAGPAATQSAGAVEAAEVVKVEPKRFKKAKGGG